MANDNAKRAVRALRSLSAYNPDCGDEEEIFTAVGDLLCDLHHLVDTLDRSSLPACYANDTAWQAMLFRAELHYSAEVNEEN